METREKLMEDIFRNMAGLRRFLLACSTPSENNKDGPTRAQAWLMFTLAHGEVMSVKELAERFSMTSSAVTQLITGLERMKLLERKTDAMDRRKLHLKLTVSGEALLEKMRKERMKLLAKRFQVLTVNELQQLKTIQEKILV
jgi:DNA-binding MarR family transcriptional regulator